MNGKKAAAVTVQLVGGVFVWQSGMAIDCDGAPNAYAPDGSGLVGADYLANAGKPGDWYGLACNAHGVPYIQASNDPCPGYYISQTALVDRAKAANDPLRYVDASKVPYVVATRDLRSRGVQLGDVAMVFHKGCGAGAIVADVGPHYGEGSVELAEALCIPSSPKNGGVNSGVTFVVFPKSSQGWPRAVEDFQRQAEALFDTWGGMSKLLSVFAPTQGGVA